MPMAVQVFWLPDWVEEATVRMGAVAVAAVEECAVLKDLETVADSS